MNDLLMTLLSYLPRVQTLSVDTWVQPLNREMPKPPQTPHCAEQLEMKLAIVRKQQQKVQFIISYIILLYYIYHKC